MYQVHTSWQYEKDVDICVLSLKIDWKIFCNYISNELCSLKKNVFKNLFFYYFLLLSLCIVLDGGSVSLTPRLIVGAGLPSFPEHFSQFTRFLDVIRDLRRTSVDEMNARR